MRIAMVSPYSWSYPGGVTRHIAALAERFIAEGHHVDVLSPVDPADGLSARLHGGAVPQELELPDYLVPLGRTVGIRANGAVSNLLVSPHGVAALRRHLKAGDYDVVHVHEPIAPAVGWAAVDWTPLPLVGTFHTYNEHRYSHGLATAVGVRRMLNRLHVRIAVSTPAAWTARRFFGGRYRVIPNGVHVDPELPAKPPAGEREAFHIVFVGQPVRRKGLPLLLRAFEALRERVPAELTVIGPSADEIGDMLRDLRDVRALGKVDDGHKQQILREADVLCAPSLGGESFGMVLIEAFAAGTPVVASDIAGYRSVVRDGVDGLLVPPGDPQALADALYGLWRAPGRRAQLAREATEAAQPFAWPRVAASVMEAYEDAIATPAPAGALRRAAVRVGFLPADLEPRAPAERLPSLERPSGTRPKRRTAALRRGASVAAIVVTGLLCWLALKKVGVHGVVTALSHTNVAWIVGGMALMAVAMGLRATAWHVALRAGVPDSGLRLRDAVRGLFIGVLVSSTLPANLGEPARALVVARHARQPWRSLPAVAGTLVSQSLLNVAAVVTLGLVTVATVDFRSGVTDSLISAGGAAVAVLAAVLVLPNVLRRVTGSWASRLQAVAVQVRSGLTVLRRPRHAAATIVAQGAAWTSQWLAVYVLLVGVHLGHRAGLVAAAAVLCAVNLTMVLPATPGDVGIFQAATAAVLHAGWHVPFSSGVAYGVILQAAELLTALTLGLPALLGEGLSWRDLTRHRLDATEVSLADHDEPLAPASISPPFGEHG